MGCVQNWQAFTSQHNRLAWSSLWVLDRWKVKQIETHKKHLEIRGTCHPPGTSCTHNGRFAGHSGFLPRDRRPVLTEATAGSAATSWPRPAVRRECSRKMLSWIWWNPLLVGHWATQKNESIVHTLRTQAQPHDLHAPAAVMRKMLKNESIGAGSSQIYPNLGSLAPKNWKKYGKIWTNMEKYGKIEMLKPPARVCQRDSATGPPSPPAQSSCVLRLPQLDQAQIGVESCRKPSLWAPPAG